VPRNFTSVIWFRRLLGYGPRTSSSVPLRNEANAFWTSPAFKTRLQGGVRTPPRWQSNGSRHPLPAPSERPLGKRTALHEIVVLIEGGFIEMVLHWQGGDHTALQLKINGSPARRVVHPCFRPTRGRGNKKIWNQPHALEPTLSKEIELGPESVGRQSIVKTTLVNEQVDETAVISVISGYVAPSNSEWFS